MVFQLYAQSEIHPAHISKLH